jgi:Fe-S oxidoreductase
LTVTYHDPCHLGRGSGIFDPPRKVIKAICDLEEMRSNRQDARCCGGGGGVRAGYPDLSLEIARRRLLDVPAGVEAIVSCCPLCIRNLRDAGGEVEVIDLVDLVARALGPV